MSQPDGPFDIAQAVVKRDAHGPSLLAKSEDFLPAWDDAALRLAERFGQRPAGVKCPAALFAAPVDAKHVAVVQVADLPGNADHPDLGFRVLVLSRPLYEALGDPFAIAARFPPEWATQGHLPTLEWPPEPLPPRTVEHLQAILKASDDTPLLLGGAQALIDGGRLLFVSPTPTHDRFRDLWQLLPDRTRGELRLATFAFSNDLDFHLLALPNPPTPWPLGYLTADQARDYPEGRYELSLQIAVEAGNQRDLNRLLARRSSRDTLRLALCILGFAMLLAVVSKLL